MLITTMIIILVVINVVSFVFFGKAFLSLEKRLSSIESIGYDSNNNEESSNDLPVNINNIEKSVASGLIIGMKKLQEDNNNHLNLLELSRKSQSSFATPIYNNSDISNTYDFDTGGELIPENLSNEEKDVLKIWYDKNELENKSLI